MSTLGRRLKEARKSKGLSQERLGIEAGLEPASASARMNQYERGVHTPSLPAITQIAAVLDLPIAFFFCTDDDEAKLMQLFHRMNDGQRLEALQAVTAIAKRSDSGNLDHSSP